MLLIGQYDSPFVRRIGVTLGLYGVSYEHRKWSVWGDAERIAEYNPLRRVPTLVLDDGTALLETFTIIDYLDELVGPERALLPGRGTLRRDGMRLVALATGLADKAVSLLYESLFRPTPSEGWVRRCELQIADTLALLDRERGKQPSPYFLGETLTHADVMTTCMLRFVGEAHPQLFDATKYPALAANAERCEALEAFQAVVQPITNNV